MWVDVSRGLIAPEEAARAMNGRESAALIERSKQLFAPPSAAQERAIRARALEHAAPTPRVWGLLVGAAVTLAAGLAVVLALRAPARLGATYQVELSAELEDARSGTQDEPAPGAIPTFSPAQRVDFTLRQVEDRPAGERELEVVLLAQDERGLAWRLGPPRRLATTPTGMAHFTERLDGLGLTAGRWQLVLVVGRPGELPAELESLTPDVAGLDQDHYEVLRVTIDVIGEIQ